MYNLWNRRALSGVAVLLLVPSLERWVNQQFMG